MNKIHISRKTIERAIYIFAILGLAIYGLKDSEVAIKMIESVSKAFSVILTTG